MGTERCKRIELTGKTETLYKKQFQFSLCSPQIQNRQACDRKGSQYKSAIPHYANITGLRRPHETGSLEGTPLATALQTGRLLPHRLGNVLLFALPMSPTSPLCTGDEEENLPPPPHTTHNENLPI